MKLPLRPNVCILLRNRVGEFLLAERHKEPGIWQFPQGGVDSDSSIEEAVLREIEEELGLSSDLVEIEKRLDWTFEYEWKSPPEHWKEKWRGQTQSFWLVQFLGKDSDVNLDTDHPEFMNWQWVPANKVLEIAEEVRRDGYRGALQEVLGIG